MDISALLGAQPASTGQLSGTNSGKTGSPVNGESPRSFAGTLQSAMQSAMQPAMQPNLQSNMQSAIAQTLAQPALNETGMHTALIPLADVTGALGELGTGNFAALADAGQLDSSKLLERLALDASGADDEALNASESRIDSTDSALMALLGGTAPPAQQTIAANPDTGLQNNAAALRAGFATAQDGQQLPAQTATTDPDSEVEFSTAGIEQRSQPLAASSTGMVTSGQATADSALPATVTSDTAQFSVSASAQPATTSATATTNLSTTPNPALALQSPLGSSAWGEEFGQHLLGMAHRGDQQVDLYLHPRELGALSVSLSLDDQGARAQFLSANAAVRGAVEQALPQLREALAQQGIALGETSVGEQQQHASQQQRGQSWTDATGTGIDQETLLDTQPTVAPATPARLNGVDLYA
ncbi:flagellar hook-length control protein FliK [Microbulbifer aggregans]|uniref:flagellar hook-length control protein FliK n=1 Tax=Microbulbifer aggregans TaxID=1769779 RepID=UPI001CFC658A|nr:flagellar hook-length control protein FliK [Microbulbifer aggregans]